MIKINPTGVTRKGYAHNISFEEIEIGAEVKFFEQSFRIESKKDGVFTGVSNYKGASEGNKTGSKANGEHNSIFISKGEVWRVPIGRRYV